MTPVSTVTTSAAPGASEIAAALGTRVMGQPEAVQEMSVALSKYLSGLRVGNILMIGTIIPSDRAWCRRGGRPNRVPARHPQPAVPLQPAALAAACWPGSCGKRGVMPGFASFCRSSSDSHSPPACY